jgi:hypothetical protein
MGAVKKRAARVEAETAHLLSRPILLDGDAELLVTTLSESARDSGLTVMTYQQWQERSAEPSRIAVLAIEGHGRRSSFTGAVQLLHALDSAIAGDAIRIVIVQSNRSKVVPPRVQRLIAAEILHQVALASPRIGPPQSRSFLRRVGLGILDTAGFRILRFG